MVFGGLTPLAAVSLAAAAGGHYRPPAAMLMAISVIGIVCTARLHRLGRTQAETKPRTPAAHEAVPTAT
ncbi:hypothetical protein [Streptomyces sp. Ncost-T10-10d]|uniref:hypothetical protein n=1 Tax=Streptomyces sp. Ncost-T10-10d TaxID=1839774 RepID=UPI00081EA5C8|nr:hypothetical protein [Streptomyces sp. Ncost-T10-10d]SCF85739.1 hypothetical protein GA0115254_119862 [Streptomyces sp. Ncost-T10-10d]